MKSSNRAIGRRRMAGVLLASTVAAVVPIVVAISPADAVSATCSAWKETNVANNLPDENRAGASCSSIGATTQVRATLNVNLGTDAHSSWFTTTNKNYYSAWNRCGFGCSAQYDTASR